MLKVICNQRDRFRARLRETEEVSHFPSPHIPTFDFIFYLMEVLLYAFLGL